MTDNIQPAPLRPPVERTDALKKLKLDQPSSATISDSAMKKIRAIADRASQESTKQQSFAKKVEVEKKKRRGGAPGDVVQLGKRKEAEPDLPRSMLRKPE